MNIIGPRIDPCGTPAMTKCAIENLTSIIVYDFWVLILRRSIHNICACIFHSLGGFCL